MTERISFPYFTGFVTSSVDSIFLFWTMNSAIAQELPFNLETLNQERLMINKNGMIILAGWAMANIAGSSYGYYKTIGSTKYFHQMNVAWNIVNLGISLYAYQSLAGTGTAALSFAESLNEAQSIEQILLLNIGLDAGYIALGGYLRERGIRKGNNRLQG